ncbi:MAG TPA: dihydrodipicolinate synthase family protein [Longimicrobiales bacterium]|nr:dihydrodipicolinate synthase family protein [Longimicrobiales bacterium]
MPEPGIRGLLLPVTTPFDPVTGDTAPVHFRENLRRWATQGVDGFVLFGSTGEGVLLDEEEKRGLVAYARDVAPGLTLVAGAGAESTRQVVRLAIAMADAGADAVIVQPPSYYGGTLPPEALRDHFQAIADASPVPVILYNIPKYTHVTMEAGLVQELARHENVVGIKDSSGDQKRLAEFTEVCAGACAVFVGSGTLMFAGLELGAAGGILAVGLLAPEICARILQLHGADRKPEAGRLQERIAPVHREIVTRLGVPGIKAALDLLGYAGGAPRSPLRPLRSRERDVVTTTLRQTGLIP